MNVNDNLELLSEPSTTILAEGPCWDEKNELLYWVDILGKSLNIYNIDEKKNKKIQLNQYIGCVVCKQSGGVVLALEKGFYFLDPNNPEQTLQFICNPELNPKNRFNDGKVDAKGRFWAGTMEHEQSGKAIGSLYRLEPNLTVHTILNSIQISNGISWSLDNKKMYFIDSPLKRVDMFDFDLESGNISNRKTIIKIDDGLPDGMCIDEEGMLWIAHWDGSCVTRWNPNNGQLLRKVNLPVSKVTSCCFGGKNLDQLFITTAAKDTDKNKEPLSGGIFILKNPGVKGIPTNSFLL
jgi:sugar lactone lactonase YvrE